jgi:hypothetical protein
MSKDLVGHTYNQPPSQLTHLMPKLYLDVEKARILRAGLGRPLETSDLIIPPSVNHYQMGSPLYSECITKQPREFTSLSPNLVHIGYEYWMEAYTLRGARTFKRTLRNINAMLNEGWLKRTWRKVKLRWFGIDKL